MSRGEQEVLKLIEPFSEKAGGLLPALRAIQDHFGYIDKKFVPVVAKSFNQTRADVFGVISFYHDFRSEKPNKHIVRICQAEACQAVGARGLDAHAKKANAADVTFEDVYCLGNCACGPSVMVDGKVYGRVGTERFDAILKTHRGKRG